MTSAALRKKLRLTDTGIAQVEKAVHDAEEKTTGEIVVALAPESDTYSFFELLFGVVFGAVCFCFLIAFHKDIIPWLAARFWDMPEWTYALFCGVVSYLFAGLMSLAANWMPIDRRIIPHSVQVTAASRRAIRCFAESGVYKTAEQSGILIFVSYLERQVRIIADSGINAKIEQSVWDGIAATLADDLNPKSGMKTADALTKAVESCGKLLAEHFPPHAENPDEISAAFIILESGS